MVTRANMLRFRRICTNRNTLCEVFLPARSLKPSNQITSKFKSWWLQKNVSYFEENRHHLVGSVIPPSSQPKLPKIRGENRGGK